MPPVSPPPEKGAGLEVLRVAAAARGERVGGRREPEDLEEFPNLEDSLVLPSFKQFEFLQHIAAFKSDTKNTNDKDRSVGNKKHFETK